MLWLSPWIKFPPLPITPSFRASVVRTDFHSINLTCLFQFFTMQRNIVYFIHTAWACGFIDTKTLNFFKTVYGQTQLIDFKHAAHAGSPKILIDPSALFATLWLCLFSSLSGPIKKKSWSFSVVSSFEKAGEYWKQLSTLPALKSRRQDDWISIHCTSPSLNGLVYLRSQHSALTHWYPCAFTASLMDAIESVKRGRKTERFGCSCGWVYMCWTWT